MALWESVRPLGSDVLLGSRSPCPKPSILTLKNAGADLRCLVNEPRLVFPSCFFTFAFFLACRSQKWSISGSRRLSLEARTWSRTWEGRSSRQMLPLDVRVGGALGKS